jgi:hypothetical protein
MAKFTGSRRLWVTASTSIALLFLAFATGAKAAPITFAQFHQTGSDPSDVFEYIDGGPQGIAEFLTKNGGEGIGDIPVTFSYLTVPAALGTVPADLMGTINGFVRLISATTAPVVTEDFGTTQIDNQEFTGADEITNTLEITLGSGYNEAAGSNLLTMTFTGGLLGEDGGLTPELSGNTNLGDTVTYTSDFLSFLPAVQDNYSLTFTSWTTTADGNGLEIDPNSNYFNTATAVGAGTFDVTIPEPSGMALAFASLLGFLAVRRPARVAVG